MSPIQYLIVILGLLLELLILGRGLKLRLWAHYPFFYAYMGYLLAFGVTLFVIIHFYFSSYTMVYWWGDIIASLLCFLVTWEVFRHVFPSGTAVHRIASNILVIVLLGFAGFALVSINSAAVYFSDLERRVALPQVLFLASTLILARYYRIPLGRNTWGMALGLGAHLSMLIINLATLGLVDSFFSLWRYIRPFGAIAVLSVWTWALWSYAPNPKLAPDRIQGLKRLLVDWQNGWNQMRAALRKAVGL